MDELSKALTEYYDPRTDLLRKQRLHEDLNRFLIDRNSWQIALVAFQQQQQQNDTNLTLPPVVIYFLLQVLEHSIRHRDGDQQQIRQILLWLFIHRFDSIPVYVRSKFAFLIVLIARCDNRWSTEEFFQISYHLIENQTLIGLLLLSTTIEEIAQFNEDSTVKRCQQLRTILNQQSTQILQILHHLLKKDFSELKDATAIKQQVLICLDRLFSRLTNLSISLELIDDLFNYASATWSLDALNCIHELLLKQHVPRTFDPILHSTLRHMTQFVHILNENPTMMNNKDKITEILRTIFSLHFKRCESIDQFPLFELLSGLYKFTLQQTSQDGFYACLDIWSIFIEYIKAKEENRLMQKENSVEKYLSVLRSLSQDLLQRLHHAQTISETLEETTDITDSETATERYIHECVDLLGKLTDLPLISGTTLHGLISLLHPDIDQFKNIQRFITVSPQDPNRALLSLTTETLPGCQQVLQGLSNLLYGFSRLSNICLLDDHNQQSSFFQTRLTLVHQFVHLIGYIVHLRIDFLDCSSKEVQQELLSVQTKSFECVTNLTPWLSQMFVLYHNNVDFRRMIHETIINIIDICTPLIDANTFDKSIGLSAAKLLYAVVSQTRQHIAMDQVNSIKLLTDRVLQILIIPSGNIQFQVYKLSVKIISSYILSHGTLAEQFFRTVFQPLNTMLHDPTNFFNRYQERHERDLVRRSFLDYTTLLTELIESIRMENNKIRQNLFTSIQPLILQLNQFLPIIINRDPDCETAVISILLISFDLLRSQMGSELIQTILQNTFTAFNIENVRTILHEAKPNAHSAVSRFLEFLALLVNEPGNTKLTQQFLPIIIDLCTNALYPAIRENFGLDIRENYYKLIHHLLINNWRYFFKGNVLTTLNGDAESTAHDQSFIQLMESIAWSFSQADIEQFRQNLSSCNELQSKCGLYTKAIFRQQMSAALLALLLNVLLHRSHELCRDDIIATFFAIITNDNTTNFLRFIQQYFEQPNIQAILNEKNQRLLIEHYGRNENDIPSFTQNLNDFIHDYRHYISTSSST